MSNKPLANPNAFTGQPPPWSLTQLDANFSAIQATINDTLTYSNYFVDQSGVANSIIISVPAALTVALTSGTVFYVKIKNTNTNTVTMTVNGLVAQAVVNPNLVALGANQLITGMVAVFCYDGTQFQFLGAATSYAITAAETANGTTPVNILFEPGDPKRYGAKADGATNDAPALQIAIDVAARGSKRVKLFNTGENRNYNITTCLNCTSDSTLNRSGIFYDGGGRRGGVTITCSTGVWAIDLSGSAWTSWSGIYLVQGASTPSYGGFVACSTSFQESLYHTFREVYVQLYNTSAPALFGTIGYALMGAEEATFLGTQTFCNTPFVIVGAYSQFSASYPSVYQNALVSATHSQGVTTFAGENLAVTWDQKGANVVLYSANTIDFGNLYCGNVNVGVVGSTYKCISVTGGTLEGCKGRIKVEQRQTLLSIDNVNAQLYGWDLNVTYGAGITNTNGVFEINPGASTVFSGNLNSIKIGVWYFDPTLAAVAGKPLILYSGTMDAGATSQKISNIEIECNQTAAQAAFSSSNPPLPALFCATVNSYDLKLVDVNYFFNAHRQVKRSKAALALGNAALSPGGAGASIATITLPPIVAGAEARTLQVRIRGLMSSIVESGGGGDTSVTLCPFDTVVSAYSIANGTVTLSGGVSDPLFTPVNSLVGNGGANYQFTALNVTQAIASRVITLTGKPIGTGAQIANVAAAAVDMEIELITSGRIGDLIYLT